MKDEVTIKTSDNKIIVLDKNEISKCLLFNKMLNLVDVNNIETLVSEKYYLIIKQFINIDKVILPEDYNSNEIYFSPDHLNFFRNFSYEELIEISKAANYLEYFYLLEITCKIIASEIENTKKSILKNILNNDKNKEIEEYEWENE